MCEWDCCSERDTGKGPQGGVEGTTVSARALRIQGLSGLIANRWLKENTKRWLKTKGDPFEDDFSLISLGCLQLMFTADMRMEPQALVSPSSHPSPPPNHSSPPAKRFQWSHSSSLWPQPHIPQMSSLLPAQGQQCRPTHSMGWEQLWWACKPREVWRGQKHPE